MAGSLVINFMPRDGPLFNYETFFNVVDSEMDDDPLCFLTRLRSVLSRDNQDEFVELINRTPCTFQEDSDTIDEIMDWDSVKCAEALFCRPTKISNPAFLTSEFFATPLHEAADKDACKITALLLQRGFSADDRCEWSITGGTDQYGNSHRGDPRLLPLGLALLSFRRMLLLASRGRPISAQSFIVRVFGGGKKYSLEILRLLAENTTEVKQEFYNYLMEGRMIEVGALLLVARSRILSPSSSTVEGEFRSISEMYDFLLDAKRHLSVSAGASLLEKNKWFEIEQTLLLLQIFDRIGDKLLALSRLDFSPISVNFFPNLAAASLLEEAGFDVMSEDVRFDAIFPVTKQLEPDYWKKHIYPDAIKKDSATCALPCWLKEAPSSVLADKSPALLEGNRVSPSALASTSSAPEIMSPQHLLKLSAPLVGSFKRFLRR